MTALLKGWRQALGWQPVAEAATTLSVDGLNIQVVRKPIRSLRLAVLAPDGAVRVSAPTRLSQRQIVEFVQDKLEWIRRQQQRLAAQAPLSLLADSAEQKAEYRKHLKMLIPTLIAEWEPKLGVKVASWGLRAMRSRWGSCNPRTDKLSFSLALAKQPLEQLEYIVVHEMLHLLEAGHGKAFKSLMDAHMPGWRNRRARLNGRV